MKYDYRVIYRDNVYKEQSVLIVDCNGFNDLLEKLREYLP